MAPLSCPPSWSVSKPPAWNRVIWIKMTRWRLLTPGFALVLAMLLMIGDFVLALIHFRRLAMIHLIVVAITLILILILILILVVMIMATVLTLVLVVAMAILSAHMRIVAAAVVDALLTPLRLCLLLPATLCPRRTSLPFC